MRSYSKSLLERAIHAMAAALEIYNKPGIPYRNESFVILAINSWELILKAKWLNLHSNNKRALYVYTNKGRRRVIKRTRSKSPFTYDMIYLARQLVNRNELHSSAFKNLEIMLEFRNSATHFFNSSQEFNTRLYEIGAACVRNFANVVNSWFQRQVTEFNQNVMPLTFMLLPSTTTASLLNSEEEGFLSFLRDIDTSNFDPDSPYQVSLNVEVKFVRSKSEDATPVRISTESSAVPVILTEDYIRDRYPLDYNALTEKCRKLYANFKSNKRYHEIRKDLENNRRYSCSRFLDPGNPRSSKKIFYSNAIILELDKHYDRR